MAWIQGWRAMDIKVLEAPPSEASPLVHEAMSILRQRLAQADSGLSHVASSAAYRAEDFSVPQEDGSKKFFTNHILGGMREVTQNPDSAKSETAGVLRHAGENVLTDQPQEEVYATVHDMDLGRGHSGLMLDVAPGTSIATERNEEIADLREKVFLAEKPQVDTVRLAAVREGRLADALNAAEATKTESGASSDHNPLLIPGAAATVLTGALLYKFAKGRGRA